MEVSLLPKVPFTDYLYLVFCESLLQAYVSTAKRLSLSEQFLSHLIECVPPIFL